MQFLSMNTTKKLNEESLKRLRLRENYVVLMKNVEVLLDEFPDSLHDGLGVSSVVRTADDHRAIGARMRVHVKAHDVLAALLTQ